MGLWDCHLGPKMATLVASPLLPGISHDPHPTKVV